MVVLTQSLRESGLEEGETLIPLGVVRATVYYYVGGTSDDAKKPPHERINAAMAAVCPEAEYVLNASLNVYPSGHPNNPERHCTITGDAYVLLSGLQE